MFMKRESYLHKSTTHDLWQLIIEQCDIVKYENDLQLKENLDKYTDEFWQIIQKECEIKSPNDIYKLNLFLCKEKDAFQKLFEKMFEKLWKTHINTVSPINILKHFGPILNAIINHLPKRPNIKIYLDRLNIFNRLKDFASLMKNPIDFLAHQTEDWRPCENFLKQCIFAWRPTQTSVKEFIKVPIIGTGGCGFITLKRLEELLRASTNDDKLQLRLSLPFAPDRKKFYLPVKICSQHKDKKTYKMAIDTNITHFRRGTRSRLFEVPWADDFDKFGALDHYFTKDEVARFNKHVLPPSKKFFTTLPFDCSLLKQLQSVNKYLTMRAKEMDANDYYKKRESFKGVLKKMDDLLLNKEVLLSQNKLQRALDDLKQFIKDEADKFKGIDRYIGLLKSAKRSRYYQHLKNLSGAITTLSDLDVLEDRIVAYHQIYNQMDHCHFAACKYRDHYTLFPFFKAQKESNGRLENHGSRERRLYALHYQNLPDEDKHDFPAPDEAHTQEYNHVTISPKFKLKPLSR